MSTPFSLPPREPDTRRVQGSATERFAMQQPVNIIEFLMNLDRRVTALENRISRIFIAGG